MTEPATFPRIVPPAGMVWPPAHGREVLRRLVSSPPGALRTDLIGQRGEFDGSGASDLLIVERGSFCLKTSPRRRFASSDDAQRALLDLARKKSALGALASEHAIVCIEANDDGHYWVWTVSPWAVTLRAQMVEAVARDDDDALAVALCAYARAAAVSVTLAARARLVLDVHPSNFGHEGERLVYLDDDFGEGHALRPLGHALLQRIEEYAEHANAVNAFEVAITSSLLELPRAERDVADVDAAFDATISRHPRARLARERIRDALAAARRPARAVK